MDCGIILPKDVNLDVITNNLTEMLAVLRGLYSMPEKWHGYVCSDSKVTLDRVFVIREVKDPVVWKGIPSRMTKMYKFVTEKVDWSSCQRIQLAGHPTRQELIAGHKEGVRVSKWNVACDWICKSLSKEYMETRDEAKSIRDVKSRQKLEVL